jgi:hypothetical protein
MVFRRRILLAIAAAVGLGLTAVPVRAEPVISSPVSNGENIDGWQVVFPAGVTLESENTPTLTLEEVGAFNSLSPLSVLFVQSSYTASPTITIAGQSLTNDSIYPLSGVTKQISPVVAGSSAPTILSTFSLSNPSTEVFNRQTVGSSSITFHGLLNIGATSVLNNGQLVISANPSTSGLRKVFFVNDDPIPVVPLPAAVWTGLSGLLGLGAIAGFRKLTRTAV